MSLLLFPSNNFCRPFRRRHPFNDIFETINSLERAFDGPTIHRDLQQQEMILLSDEGFSVTWDVSSYKPDELKLRLDGDVLSIEGEHKEENEQVSIHLRLQRSIRIPVNQIDLSSLQSSLDQNGNLSIHAPLIEKKKQLNGQEIPIQITGQQKETGTIEN